MPLGGYRTCSRCLHNKRSGGSGSGSAAPAPVEASGRSSGFAGAGAQTPAGHEEYAGLSAEQFGFVLVPYESGKVTEGSSGPQGIVMIYRLRHGPSEGRAALNYQVSCSAPEQQGYSGKRARPVRGLKALGWPRRSSSLFFQTTCFRCPGALRVCVFANSGSVWRHTALSYSELFMIHGRKRAACQ